MIQPRYLHGGLRLLLAIIASLVFVGLPDQGWPGQDLPSQGQHVTPATIPERVIAAHRISPDTLNTFIKDHHQSIGHGRHLSDSSPSSLAELLASGRLILIDPSGAYMAAGTPVRTHGSTRGTLYVGRGIAMTDNATLAKLLVHTLAISLHQTPSLTGQGCALLVASSVVSEEGIIGTWQAGKAENARLKVSDPSLTMLSYHLDPAILEKRFGLCGRLLTTLHSAEMSLRGNSRVILGDLTLSDIGDAVVNQADLNRAHRLINRDGRIFLEGADSSHDRAVPNRSIDRRNPDTALSHLTHDGPSPRP
ncbi:MAG: hypothetical protein ACT4OO_11530 [Nitrospiraceae bacterium]